MQGLGLGFRPPQFSEDFAWLPDWLQPQQIRSQEPSKNEELAFRDQDEVEDVKEMSKDDEYEVRNKNLHLFLSGEDNSSSPVTVAESPGDVLHFHLHLSFSNDSTYSKIHASGASQTPCGSVPHLAFQQIGSAEKKFENDQEKMFDKGSTLKDLNDAEVDDAIELSVAASEAVVIHEMVEGESALKSLPSSAVVEVALRVKQARLERFGDPHDCIIEETDEEDSLCDLDDNMADAFEDVGLSFSGNHDQDVRIDISQVKETPISDEPLKYRSCFKRARLFSKKPKNYSSIVLSSDKTSEKHQLLEPIHLERSQDGPSDLAFGPHTFNKARHIDNMFPQSTEKLSSCSTMQKKLAFDVKEGTLYQKQASPTRITDNAGEDKGNSNGPDGFQRQRFISREMKEFDATAQLKCKIAANITKPFVAETSFLSESTDTVSDENSVMKTSKVVATVASQSSIRFGGSCSKASEDILLSQEVVGSASLSLVDPLCSIVPCSISTEHPESIQQISQNDIDDGDIEKCDNPTSEISLTNFPSDSNVDCCTHNQRVTEVDQHGNARRKLSLLRNYSMLLPSYKSVLMRNLVLSGSSCSKLDSAGPSNSQSFLELQPLKSLSEHCTAKNSRKIHIGEIHKYKCGDQRTSKDLPTRNKSLPQPYVKGRFTLNLGNKRKRSFQATRHSAKDILVKTSRKQLHLPAITAFHRSKTYEEVSLQHTDQVGDHGPKRKRVRFLEAQVPLQVEMRGHNSPSTLKNSSLPCTRSRFYDPLFDSKLCGTKILKDRITKKMLIFEGVEFLLTGFSRHKEKEIEELVQKHGGNVLLDVSFLNSRGQRSSKSFCRLPLIIVSLKKLRTTKFLCGCALHALILKVSWVMDSIAAGFVMPPEKYMIVQNQVSLQFTGTWKPLPPSGVSIFKNVGFMLQGKRSFFIKFSKIIKLAGGQAFKTLQQLIKSLDTQELSEGIIVTEYGSTSRQLRHCALERKIPLMSANWIIETLYLGKFIPPLQKDRSSLATTLNISEDAD